MEILATCHVHSSWSYDGSWSLEDLAGRFRDRGTRVLMTTEHDRGFSIQRFTQFKEACARASSSEILVVPGIEYSDALNRVHVLVWGDVPFLGENLPTIDMLKGVKAANGIAVLAHPSRKSAWQCFQPEWGELLLGIEAWNRKYDGWAPSETAAPLLQATNALPFVGLDFHTQRQSFPLNMTLDIQSDVSEAAVLDSMRSRRCKPCAFGAPITQYAFRTAQPALRLAERSRRAAVRFAKSIGAFSR